MGLNLNLGCGNHRADGVWVNVDSYPGVEPDVVASADRLPFADGSADKVYCGHLLEHVTLRRGVPALLAEIRRVLTPTGRLCVVGPDYTRAAENPEWQPLLPLIRDGGNRWPGDRHRWLSTAATALKAILPAFPGASEVAVASLWGWPVVDPVGWQFAVLSDPTGGSDAVES